MSEIENSKFAENLSDQIDLLEVFFVLVKGIRFIASVTIFFSIIGIIYSLLLPNIYKSEALLAPVDESSSLGGGSLNQVSGLAGLAGFALPSADGGSNANKAIQVMGSLSFFENYIMPKIFLPDLMAVKFWDENKKIIIYDESVFNKNSNSWVNNSPNSEISFPSAQKSFEVFKGHFNMLQDENGYIVLSMKHQSPSLAKEWIEIFVEEINSFYRQKDKLESEKAVVYLNEQIASTTYSEIRAVTASILEKEIQKLTLIEANRDYVFEYINPPSVMEKKSEPYRSLMVILFAIFGLILGGIIILIRHYFSKENNTVKKINS